MKEAETEIVRELYRAKNSFAQCIAEGKPIKVEHKTAYCTAARPLVLNKWNQQHPSSDDKN